MAVESVQAAVHRIVADILSVALETVTDASTFAGLRADDLDMIEIAMQIEDEFKITLEDDALLHLKTVGELVVLVEHAAGTPPR